jgi:ParB/RepB/Spo0J family partition protein
MAELLYIPIEQIRENPVALRTVDRASDGYQELVASVKGPQGILNPINVRKCVDEAGNSFYQIVDGLHRFSAAKDAGLKSVPAQIFTEIADDEVFYSQIIANATKVETKKIEYAQMLKRILSMHPTWTIPDLAGAVKKRVAWVDDQLALLKITNEGIREQIDNGKIPAVNAYNLAKLPQDEQVDFVQDAMKLDGKAFTEAVTARCRELRDAKHKGKQVGESGFSVRAKIQKIAVIEAEISEPKNLSSLISKSKVKTAIDGATLALKWVLQQDEDSIEKAKAAYEADKKMKAEVAAKRKAEALAKKEAEAKAIAEKIS